MLDDPPSDVEEKEPAYESDRQSDKQSEKYVTSPSAASVSSKLIPQISSRGNVSSLMAYQSMNNAKSRVPREDRLVTEHSELKV